MGQVPGEKILKKYHNVKNVRFDKHFLLLTVDGRDFRIDLRQQSKKLASADERIKGNFEISPLGYGIHWPELDEDLSIDGMIKARRRGRRDDLPVEQPKKFEFVVNLKAAKQIGITIPSDVLARATRIVR